MQSTNNFIDFLKTRVTDKDKHKLPGKNAHLKLVPVVDKIPYRPLKPPDNSKSSSVMIILYANGNGKPEDIKVLLTLRSKSLMNHGGQISFPGGRNENGESFLETALRETQEEIGISPERIKIIGELSSLYVEPSNSVITPFIGYINKLPSFVKNPAEVDEIFFVKLKELVGKDTLKTENWRFQGKNVLVPLWRVHPTTPLWGATAMILNELIELFKEFTSN
jgi:8-oxo-dGTP pyrophosphatase MutT (NUDIX family)